MGSSSVVYFATAIGSGRIKLGWTTDIGRRFRSQFTDCPFPIEVLCTVPSDVVHESILHKAMREWRVHKEWFIASPMVLKVASMLASGGRSREVAIKWINTRGLARYQEDEAKYQRYLKRKALSADRYEIERQRRRLEEKARQKAETRERYLKKMREYSRARAARLKAEKLAKLQQS